MEGRGRSPARALLRTMAALIVPVAAYDAWVVLRLRNGPRPDPLAHDGTVGTDQPGTPLRLAVLGDSAAAGYGLRDPDAAYPRAVARAVAQRASRPVALVSHAVDGARTEDLASRQVPAIAGEAWDAVVCSVGVNDALAARSPRRVERDTIELVRAARAAAPDADLVLVGCPDLGRAPGFPWPLHHVIGWSCRRVARAQEAAARREGVRFVALPGDIGADRFGDDGVHPGVEGQRAAAELTAATIGLETTWTSD